MHVGASLLVCLECMCDCSALVVFEQGRQVDLPLFCEIVVRLCCAISPVVMSHHELSKLTESVLYSHCSHIPAVYTSM